MASSNRSRVVPPICMNRHGLVWWGAGAVTASTTHSLIKFSGNASALKWRTVRRARTAPTAPNLVASCAPKEKASSERGRISAAAPGPSLADTLPASPRTIATGSPADLPRTISAAPAISSAIARALALSSLPWRSKAVSSVAASMSGSRPATPMA